MNDEDIMHLRQCLYSSGSGLLSAMINHGIKAVHRVDYREIETVIREPHCIVIEQQGWEYLVIELHSKEVSSE